MKTLLIAAIMVAAATTALAATDNFDQAAPGSMPPDWTCGVTGRGSPVWRIEATTSSLGMSRSARAGKAPLRPELSAMARSAPSPPVQLKTSRLTR